MEEFEPKKRIKIFTKEFYIKYSYVFIIALVLFLGTSFSLTFFTQNLNIASGSLTTAPLDITLTNSLINATSLTVPTNDQDGLSEFAKQITITNNGTADGKVKLTLERTSGLNLTDMKYALVVNGAIQVIDELPNDGVILETAIMGNEVIDIELRLWPKTTYAGSDNTFVGQINSEIRYLGEKASNRSDLANSYVEFNCNGNACETWRIVGVSSERLVLTRDEDLEGATARVDSGKYNPSLSFNDNSMINSVSTDNKNVYLSKTVKIDSGDGSQSKPYKLINNIEREPDKKIIATITYKNGDDTVGTQYIYYNETNYISQVLNDSSFQGWTDGTNDYNLGDTINFTTDTNLSAFIVTNVSALGTIKKNAIIPTNPINFANISSDTNGKGVYILPGTEGDINPIYYYRGAVDNNNVVFGDFCWQIVRTTDTGGIKMIYNGVATKNNNAYECNGTPAEKGIIGVDGTSSISMTGAAAFGRKFSYNLDTQTFTLEDIVKENNTNLTWNDNNADKLVGTYTCMSSDTTCTRIYYVGFYVSNTNAAVESITIGDIDYYRNIGRSVFNTYSGGLSPVGYMYNKVYLTGYTPPTSGAYYGSDVSYDSIEGKYTLTGSIVTTLDDSHHYSCDLTTANGSCSIVRYYYFAFQSSKFYMTLTDGEQIEDAIYKMTGNGSTIVRERTINQNYELNKIDSLIKSQVENWFKNNLTNEIDVTKQNYQEYLEDTIYCNDRSFKTEGNSNIYTQSGWNPNGGSLTTHLHYGTHNRLGNSFYSTTNVPSMDCPNETDRFTVSSTIGNGKLNYPVGLLTIDETVLAGVAGNNNADNNNYYLVGPGFWLLSPSTFRVSVDYVFVVQGSPLENPVSSTSGIRPVVSLKPGVEFESRGDGSSTNPYVVIIGE